MRTRSGVEPARPSSWPKILAPGKLFLAGEYGVLTGAEALVMAVDKHVVMDGVEAPSDLEAPDPLMDALIEEASRITTPPRHAPAFDARLLLRGPGRKLGLGSSAAKAAAVLAGAFVLAGEDISKSEIRRRALISAWRGHRAAGGGSGADVAASVLGGAVRFRLRIHDGDGLLENGRPGTGFETRQASLSSRHLPIVLHGGSSLSTRLALSRLKSAVREGSTRHIELVRRLAKDGELLAKALTSSNPPADEVTGMVEACSLSLLELTDSLELGASSGREALRSASKIAADHGGAAKPSGAGGGDLILVFVPSIEPEERREVASRLDRAGLDVLDVGLDSRGVRPAELGRPTAHRHEPLSVHFEGALGTTPHEELD